MYVYIYVYIDMYIYIYVCVYIHMYVYIYTHVCTYLPKSFQRITGELLVAEDSPGDLNASSHQRGVGPDGLKVWLL